MSINPLTSSAMANMDGTPNHMGQVNPMTQLSTMQPQAQGNFMGDPSGNMGMNRLSMPWQAMLAQEAPSNTYARGGVVMMADGGQPAQMLGAAQGAPQGGLAQAAGAAGEHPLAEVAAALDMGEETQLTFINQEEMQALEQAGQPAQMAEEVAPDPALIEQLMQGVEGEDYFLVYLTQEQFQLLTENFGEPSINEASGLPQFGFFKSITNAVKSVVKSPIVQALAPMALNAFAPGVGSALGGALGLGSTGTSALLGGGLGLLGGGGLKGALTGAAMGGLGQMGADWLGGGQNPFSGIFGGASPSTGGINPSAGGVGLNPSSASKLGELNIPSVLGGGEPAKSGLSALMPTSTAGKIGLGLGALSLLGGAGSKREQPSAPPPPDPRFAASTRPMPQWEWKDGRLIASNQGPAPTGALYARGGLAFADGGMPPTMGVDNGVGGPLGGVNPMMSGALGGMGGVGGMEQAPMTPPGQAETQAPMGMGVGAMAGGLGQAARQAGAMPGMGALPQGAAEHYQALLNAGMAPGMDEIAQMERPRKKGRGKRHAKREMEGGLEGALSDRDRMMLMQSLAMRRGPMMAEGGYLRGAGDGVSDDIPATIGHHTPAKLSGGEFVLPARVVSELGNGSSEAGAKRLHQFMNKVMSTRRSTKDVGADTKAYQHLPA